MAADETNRLPGSRELRRVLPALPAAAGDGAGFAAAVGCATAEEISELLRAARADGVALVSAGARSLLGRMVPAEAGARRILLDTTACRGVLALDAEALLLRVRAGTPLPQARAAAEEAGLRLVGVEPSDPGTVGGWLATTARIHDPVLALPVSPALGISSVLPDGTAWRSITSPRSACGPDLGALFFGTGGAFGVLTEAALRLAPGGSERKRISVQLNQPVQAAEVLRRAALGPLPPAEGSALIWVDGRGARVELGFEGTAGLVEEAVRELREHLKSITARELRSGEDAPLAVAKDLPVAGGVRWSRLERVITEFNLPLVDALMLDRPEVSGCRLRVLGGEPASLAARLRRFLDPDGERGRARAAEFERLRRVKRELDPGSLLNPQALPWLEREVLA